MPGPAPKPREQLRRRNRPEAWTVLPAGGSKAAAPSWPLAQPTPAQRTLWKHLWALPVAAWWREVEISPWLVARYVLLATTKPGLSVLSRMEEDLALSPGGMVKAHLMIEIEEPKAARASRYRHVTVED